MQRRNLVLLVLILLVASRASASEPPRLPARQAELEPFDLTYLPAANGTPSQIVSQPGENRWSIPVVIALRPAAILAQPYAQKHAGLINDMLKPAGFFLGLGPFGPGVENVESIIVRGSVWCVSKKTEAEAENRGSAGIGGDVAVVRAVKPFDWFAAVRRCWPNSITREYRGAVYLACVAQRPPAAPPPNRKDTGRVFYCPDDRTLVFDTEDAIRAVIDRVKSGKPALSPPGWEKVERCTIAIAFDNHDKKWLHSLTWPGPPYVPLSTNGLLSAADDITLGVDIGSSTCFRLISYSWNQFQAREARRGRAEALLRLGYILMGSPAEPPRTTDEAVWMLLADLMEAGKVTASPLGFDYVGEVPDDLLYYVMKRLETSITSTSLLIRGWELAKDHKYDEAIAVLSEAIRINSKNDAAFVSRGHARYSKGLVDEAISDFTEALRLNPRNAYARLTRGQLFALKREYDKAAADLNEVLRLEPRNANALIARGAMWLSMGDSDKAWTDFNEEIRLDAANGTAYARRGWVSQARGDNDQAIADYTEAIRLGDTSWEVRMNRGILYGGKGEYRNALADFDEAIRLNPALADGYRFRGFSRRQIGDVEGAIGDYTEAIRLGPKNSGVFNYRGYARMMKGDYVKALDDFDEALRLKPDSSRPLLNRAVIRSTCPDSKLRDGAKAVADAKAACDQYPVLNAFCLATLAAAYAEDGQFDKAVEYQKQALQQKDTEDNRRRLKLFEDGWPYHQLKP
jgi:tetratricopeptide (TPR) repeat protein